MVERHSGITREVVGENRIKERGRVGRGIPSEDVVGEGDLPLL